ncbi:MAG: hypothetical protein JRI25_04855 [Deltaproteobacteria bacterium]|nr:hypothetical protein [Deltaproteobacteria bacterium]
MSLVVCLSAAASEASRQAICSLVSRPIIAEGSRRTRLSQLTSPPVLAAATAGAVRAGVGVVGVVVGRVMLGSVVVVGRVMLGSVVVVGRVMLGSVVVVGRVMLGSVVGRVVVVGVEGRVVVVGVEGRVVVVGGGGSVSYPPEGGGGSVSYPPEGGGGSVSPAGGSVSAAATAGPVLIG